LLATVLSLPKIHAKQFAGLAAAIDFRRFAALLQAAQAMNAMLKQGELDLQSKP
jgi:hypothetical protein